MVLVRSHPDRTSCTIGKLPVLHIVLWEPEIPPNTGNIARLCAATDTRLHLVGRRGFRLDDRQLKRAGLDYWPSVDWHEYADWEEFVEKAAPQRIWLATTRAKTHYTQVEYRDGDGLLFGSESKGVPETFHQRFADASITIPMVGPTVRSLNLATAVGIVLYEALRQVRQW
jgi:tRNA (cytidine/uridine-2'-O-)-methyltransferase